MIRQAKPPCDQEVLDLLSGVNNQLLVSFLNSNPTFDSFYTKFLNWISESQRINAFIPTDFQPVFTAGTTQAFHNFYLQHPEKQLVLLRGEYPYHRDVWDSFGKTYLWYEESHISDQSMLIISLPFSGSGNVEDKIFSALDICEERQATVMLDFALVGLGAELDMTRLKKYSCVKQMAFSFSKMFNIGRFRVGICWMREPIGPLQVLNHWNYINWPGMYFAEQLMKHFSFDYMSSKYLPQQRAVCIKEELSPSESYFFGLGGDNFQEYSRDGIYNRVCLTPLFK